MGNEEFDISAVVGKLMSDPKVADLVKGLKEGRDPSLDTQLDTRVEQSDGGMGEVYQKLPEIMSKLSPLMNGGGEGRVSADTEKRNRLLAALKPYLSAGRREMVDQVMSYSKLVSLLDLFPDKK